MSSADAPADAVHYVPALHFSGDEPAARARLRELLLAMPRAELVEERPGYLHVTFTSALLRFVDDVEVWIDADAGSIQIRSASRVGYGDMGVNRARYETIAAAWGR